MDKINVNELDSWSYDESREYDRIFIVRSRKKFDWYNTSYYVWSKEWVIKIICLYDYWSINTNWFNINIDFEVNLWWIKMWSNYWKLLCSYWWSISVIKK